MQPVSTAKTNVVQISTAEAAFRRVKPFIERAGENMMEAMTEIAIAFRGLPHGEKPAFCKKLNLSVSRVREIAIAAEAFPKKLEILKSTASPSISILDVGHFVEIGRTPDKTLRAAVDAGMFEPGKEVTVTQIRRLRKAGQVPDARTKAKSGMAKAKDDLDKAADKLKSAAVNLHSLVHFMQKVSATQADGLDAFKLVCAIEGIADAIGQFDSKTRSRAIEIIQGKRKRGLPLPKFGVRPASGSK